MRLILLTGASVGIISILLHMRLLLGPRRRKREGGRKGEEEAADLISFSPSLIKASYCGHVGQFAQQQLKKTKLPQPPKIKTIQR